LVLYGERRLVAVLSAASNDLLHRWVLLRAPWIVR
jgi:hypothetical protein